MGKYGSRDVRMADDILWGANQIGFIKTTDFYEGVIAVRNNASIICRRDEFLLRCE
jgi:hypothetical protein